jgi:WD40 repeat protein
MNVDAGLIATGGMDGQINILDLFSGEVRGLFESGGGAIHALRFNPQGDILASGSLNGAVRLWDVKKGACLQTFRINRPYEKMDITDVTGLNESQKAMLRALGAIEKS